MNTNTFFCFHLKSISSLILYEYIEYMISITNIDRLELFLSLFDNLNKQYSNWFILVDILRYWSQDEEKQSLFSYLYGMTLGKHPYNFVGTAFSTKFSYKIEYIFAKTTAAQYRTKFKN